MVQQTNRYRTDYELSCPSTKRIQEVSCIWLHPPHSQGMESFQQKSATCEACSGKNQYPPAFYEAIIKSTLQDIIMPPQPQLNDDVQQLKTCVGNTSTIHRKSNSTQTHASNPIEVNAQKHMLERFTELKHHVQ